MDPTDFFDVVVSTEPPGDEVAHTGVKPEPMAVPVEYIEGLTSGDAAGIRHEALVNTFSNILDEVRTLTNSLQVYKTQDHKIQTLREIANACDRALAVNAELEKK